MNKKLYFKVLGYPYIGLNGSFILGYTSSIRAWLSDTNGWSLDQLHFIPMYKELKIKNIK